MYLQFIIHYKKCASCFAYFGKIGFWPSDIDLFVRQSAYLIFLTVGLIRTKLDGIRI